MLPSDLPGDLPSFLERFGTDEQCRSYLFQARWPEAKRWLLGTHHGAVRRKHLQAYLDEFVWS